MCTKNILDNLGALLRKASNNVHALSPVIMYVWIGGLINLILAPISP